MPSSIKVRNWKEYNTSLEKRGEIIFHIEEEYYENLYYQGIQKRGGAIVYSKQMYEFIATIRIVFKLPIRAAIGFAKGLLRKIHEGKVVTVPHFSHASREINKLSIKIKSYTNQKSGIALSFDSTGVSVHNTSGWHQRKHGKKNKTSPHEKWKKVHIGMDLKSGQILDVMVTHSNLNDCEVVSEMLDNLGELKDRIETIIGDGAYDTYEVYEKAHEINVKVIVPPDITSKAQDELSNRRAYKDYLRDRDKTIKFIRQYDDFETGRKEWKKISGYHERSKIESTMYRFKKTHGFSLIHKKDDGIINEIKIKANILNRMLALGRAQYA
jgi:hypothetical protein